MAIFGAVFCMRIRCLHGYFIFDELKAGQISQFMSLFGFAISAVDNYYTFDFLKAAPEYSITAKPYLGVPAVATFEGSPWEIMRANGLVYDFDLDLVKPILAVTTLFQIETAANYFVSDGLILPGSVTADGSRVRDYSAWLSFDSMKFKYSEVSYE